MQISKDILYLEALLYGLKPFYAACNGTLSDLKVLENIKKDSDKEIITDIIRKAEELTMGISSKGESDNIIASSLKSILQYIGGNTPTEIRYLGQNTLSVDKGSFPQTGLPAFNIQNLWHDFCEEMNLCSITSVKSFAETLLGVLFKYTTNISCGYNDFDDVSLYDYSKTLASVAICLNNTDEDDSASFLIIGGDLSGIQNYIYQIVSKYASKNLKGRSYYVRLLSNVIVRYLLKQLGLYNANVIYNSGGSFYILAPNTQSVKGNLRQSIEVIEKNLFKAHGTSIYVAIDYVEVEASILTKPTAEVNLCTVWKGLFDKRDKKKHNKFSSIIAEDYESFFTPFNNGGAYKRDSITGEEISEEDESYSKKMSDLNLKKSSWEQIELGKALKDTDYIAISEKKVSEWKNNMCIEPIELGYTYYFLKNKDVNALVGKTTSNEYDFSLVSLNDFDVNAKLHMACGVGNVHTLEFYGGNSFDGRTFEDLCNPEGSYHRLGVLRMDVDNLGNIFQSGIAPEEATFSRYAALSRSFDYFFSGYLNTLQQEIAKEEALIIYSGGDDIFIVGTWTKSIELANAIQKDFKEYTCYNPQFSISGGISIHTPKYPIMKSATESDEEEKNAKEHSVGDKQKNSISFMQTPLNWDEEYDIVEKLKDKIKTLSECGLSKSFSSKIITLSLMANIKDHKPTNFKSYWMLTYDLSRMKSETKQNEVKLLLDNCIKECCGKNKNLDNSPIKTDYHPLELWAFAARWAELETRTNN